MNRGAIYLLVFTLFTSILLTLSIAQTSHPQVTSQSLFWQIQQFFRDTLTV